MSKKALFALSVIWTVMAACAPGLGVPAVEHPQPTSTCAPEAPATALEDVVGVWRAAGEGGVMIVTFKMDGTFTAADTLDREHDSGEFQVEGGRLVFDSEAGLGVHEAFVTRRDGVPFRLRLSLVDDPFSVRIETITDRTLIPVKQ
jgi:hypothetical protein